MPTKMRPIIFCGEMVRAVREGRKTQTRRVMKPQPEPVPDEWIEKGWNAEGDYIWASSACRAMVDLDTAGALSPYGMRTNLLWVRETCCIIKGTTMNRKRLDGALALGPDKDLVFYKATDRIYKGEKLTPSIHMPRWASRITLEVTEVRVERVQEITDADAKAEGIPDIDLVDSVFLSGKTYRSEFQEFWDSINGKRGYGWAVNPWVWVVDFEEVT